MNYPKLPPEVLALAPKWKLPEDLTEKLRVAAARLGLSTGEFLLFSMLKELEENEPAVWAAGPEISKAWVAAVVAEIERQKEDGEEIGRLGLSYRGPDALPGDLKSFRWN